MTNAEIIAIIATSVVSIFGFLLKSAVSSVTDRLDAVGTKVDILVAQFAAATVRAETNSAEIERLRERLHEFSNIVTVVHNTQQRCKHCN
jgi:uncharacterized protein YecE (DUF72 family)